MSLFSVSSSEIRPLSVSDFRLKVCVTLCFALALVTASAAAFFAFFFVLLVFFVLVPFLSFSAPPFFFFLLPFEVSFLAFFFSVFFFFFFFPASSLPSFFPFFVLSVGFVEFAAPVNVDSLAI